LTLPAWFNCGKNDVAVIVLTAAGEVKTLPSRKDGSIKADQSFTLGEISFNPEPTATANFPRFSAVAVGSGLNERKTDRP
jgi:hypothetical protein